jgi:hypothetical protein
MKLRRQRLLLVGLLVLLAPLGACSSVRGVIGKLGELNRLQQRLQQQTGQYNIQVNLNNGQNLSISFMNSPGAKLPADQKRVKALEVARLAYNDYPERADLASVRVTFAAVYDVGPLHYNNGFDSTEFTISQLTSDQPAPTETPSQTNSPSGPALEPVK